MFLDFFYNLRSHRVPVTTHNWLTLLDALSVGLHDHSLDGFYQLARCVVVGSEANYDGFDQAFSETFHGKVSADVGSILDQLNDWLRNPKLLEQIDPELRAAIEAIGIDELRKRLQERLAEQRHRHEGGNRWIGTGGTSPFGQGGFHPSGVRIGGMGGARSALAVADARRYREFRRDVVLDTRQIAAALRRLRRLKREHPTEQEIDIEATVKETAKMAGELEVVMQASRKNTVRMLLLLDVGGSMDPHAHLVNRLFSAAYQSGGFSEFQAYYFHNCVYSEVYEDATFQRKIPISQLMQNLSSRWYLVVVGDAWMHPGELNLTSGDFWNPHMGPIGYHCMAQLASHFSHNAWLNPEARSVWNAPSIVAIEKLFPMFSLNLEGLAEMVDALRAGTPLSRRAKVKELLERTRGV